MIRRRLTAAIAAISVSAAATAEAQPVPPPGPEEKLQKQIEAQQADLEEQGARIRELEKQLKALIARQKEAPSPAPPPAPPPPAPPAPPVPTAGLTSFLPDFLKDLSFSGYLQAQYENHQDAQDQLDPSGAPLNDNRFVLRRTRLKLEKSWEYASAMVEVDGNSVNGPSFGLQHAEASVLYRGSRPSSAPPFVQITFGLFDTPFGYELVESPKTRWFMERSLASRSFFPGEPDVGARVSSALGWFRASVAIINGNPLGERTGFPLRDPANAKDITARVGAELTPAPWLFLAGGVSVYNGKGFHAGTSAGKSSLQWKDTNEDGIIEVTELIPVSATTSTPSQTFDRWIIGADLRFAIKTPIGPTRGNAEVMVANNMDRGLFIADPVFTGIDSRELGVMAGITQEILDYGVVGFRFDVYNPNSDAQDRQGGKLLPTSQTVTTFSPMAGLTLPGLPGGELGTGGSPGRARLLFQYDVNRNNMGRDPRGVPTNLASDVWTLRLQGAL